VIGLAVSVFLAAVRDLRDAWPRLLTTDLIYKLVAFVVLSPLAGAALRLFMATRGSSVLADQDIVLFILTPIGAAALLVIGSVSVAIVALEQACLMAIGFGEIRGFRVRTTDALRLGARHAWSVVVLALRIFTRVLLVILPFLLAVGLVYLVLLRNHDINYYLAEQPPVFFAAAAAAAVLLLVMAVLIIRRLLSWAFALPMMLFERQAPHQAMSESANRTRGHTAVVGLTLVAWGVAAALLSVVPLGLVTATGQWLVPKFAGSIPLLLVLMSIFLLVWGVLSLLASLFNSVMFALLTVQLYDRFGSTPDAQLTTSAIAERLEVRRSSPTSGRWVTAGLAAAAVIAGLIGYQLVQSVRLEDDVVVIAHRGAAGSAPENTLAAVALAVEQGADIVEIDVQEDADGEVVVVHDSDLMRVGGSPVKIWDATSEELAAVDIGSWFGPEFADQRVPTLEQVLAICKGRSQVDIELKYYGHNQRLEERVAEIVESMGMEDEVILMSLDSALVRSMKALRPNWTVGLLTAKAVGDLTRSEADFLAVHVSIADSGFIRRAHAAGKEVYVWTVNNRFNLSRMMSRGVDGVITDHPELARQVLERRAELSTAERLMVTAAFWIGLEPREPPPESDGG
jgi:glycerophosphoryl diester phosphodiesterase